MRVTVRVNTSKLDAIARDTPKAAVSALNKMVGQAKTKTSAEIRTHYNISKSNLEKPVGSKVKGDSFALVKAKANQLYAILRIRTQRIPLIRFGGRWKRSTGATATIEVGKAIVMPHTFTATMASGHKGLFIRKGAKRLMTKGRYAGTKIPRQPILERSGPSVAQMAMKGNTLKNVQAFIKEKIEALFLHESIYFKNRKGE